MLPIALRPCYSTLGLGRRPGLTILGLDVVMIPIAELAFHQRLGHVLTLVEKGGFWPALVAFLRDGASVDSWVAMIFRNGQSPQVLYEGETESMEDTLFDEYVRGLYILDPFYLFSVGTSFTSGLYRLDDVAPEHFRETEYFRRYFVHNVVADEIQFLVPLPRSGTLSLSFGSKRRFTDVDIGSFYLHAPWILPLMRIAVQVSGSDLKAEMGSASELEERLRSIGNPNLTDREVQTALLLLSGYSTKSIARQMGISPETVKVHRRNLYDKMGVSTQAALFALFLNVSS